MMVVAVDTDGMVSLHYHDSCGRPRRRVLFRLNDNNVLLLHPATKCEAEVGAAVQSDGLLIVAFPLPL